MRPIAKRLVRGLLAATQERSFCGICGELDRGHGCGLMRAIAERLIGRMTAGAPEIGFAFLQFDLVGGSLGDVGGVGHVANLSGWLRSKQMRSRVWRQVNVRKDGREGRSGRAPAHFILMNFSETNTPNTADKYSASCSDSLLVSSIGRNSDKSNAKAANADR